MAVITDAMSAEVKRTTKVLFGNIATQPALLMSDGVSLQYACDVNIGPTDPSGVIDQYKDRYTGKATLITGLPGQPDSDFQVEDVDTINTMLHNCLIDKSNEQLRWADVGSPVRVERTSAGVWRVVGFSVEMPGTWTLTPVNLGDLTIGESVDLSVSIRRLTLGEFGMLVPFGTALLGVTGVFLGETLQKLVV
jgi:hypothetical protein